MHVRETERTQPAWEKLQAAKDAYWNGMGLLRSGELSLAEGRELADALMVAHHAFNDSWEQVD